MPDLPAISSRLRESRFAESRNPQSNLQGKALDAPLSGKIEISKLTNHPISSERGDSSRATHYAEAGGASICVG
jgi:hypothetical protein